MVRKLQNLSNPSAVQKNPCLKSTMEKLFEKRSRTGDIKFNVNGEEIRAHRCVLAALSPKYEAQFYGDLAELDTINIQDVSPAAFIEFLQFFYMEDLTLSLANMDDILNLAKQSLVDELVIECSNFLKNNIGVDKLLWCYQLARTYDVKSLEKYCGKLIGMNIKSLFETADFLSCDHDMLCRILDFNALNCKETDVFNGCIAWARAKCEQDDSDATDTANLRLALGGAIFKIRFCSMSNEEFATISRQYSRLLSPQESIDVFEAIALNANEEHASAFGENNSTPRGTIQSSLVCSFAKRPRVPFDSTTGNCFIDFTTDKPIALNGFIISNRIEDSIVAKLILGINGREYHPALIIAKSENATKLEFDIPFPVPANERYMIRVDSRAFTSSNSGLFGFDLEDQVTQNGVTFNFVFCARPSPITHLLFDADEA